ncbi:MAG: TIGR03560 family F420-dependent LLM class oxidoreductase [Acidimicrobiia bacterium]
MQLSIWPNTGNSWEVVHALASHAEATGWDGVWIADHFMPAFGGPNDPTNECFALVAALAAAVPRVRIGTLVCGNTYRNPAVLAKQAATVDVISGGRFVLGLGAGWQESEHTAYGIPFPTVTQRLDMLDEACQIVKALTTSEVTSFDGRHYQLHDAPLSPKPIQEPMPLLVGGAGERRTLRIAAQYADEWNCWGTPEVLAHKNAVLDRYCSEIGRDPSTIKRSTQALVHLSEDTRVLDELGGAPQTLPVLIGTSEELADRFREYAAAGVDEFVVSDRSLGDDVGARIDTMDRIVAVARTASP